jgi:D-beta-D-heptose 7-phosphate kinase/D-beta-D-heptose 1-phosphate adenosyltransferase
VKRILVVGDSCVDEFVYGVCKRLNPEAPTPVFSPIKSSTNPGMAGNVVENLRSLESFYVDFVTNKNQIIKTRYVEENSNYILLRVDQNDTSETASMDDLMKIGIHTYDVVIVSDYNKGFLSEEIIEYILKMARCSFIDTKKPFGEWIKFASWIKINKSESLNPLHNYEILKEVKSRMIITLGSEGACLNDKIYPIKPAEVRDVVGAGDTFMSALVAAHIKTYDIKKSIKFANDCSSRVVRKRGVTDMSEMINYYKQLK